MYLWQRKGEKLVNKHAGITNDGKNNWKYGDKKWKITGPKNRFFQIQDKETGQNLGITSTAREEI